MFRYKVPNTPNFTVESFASTRFGSYRKRQDHEQKFVEAIKDFVNNDHNNQPLCNLESNNSATTTNSSGGAGSGGPFDYDYGIWSSASNETSSFNFTEPFANQDGLMWAFTGMKLWIVKIKLLYYYHIYYFICDIFYDWYFPLFNSNIWL